MSPTPGLLYVASCIRTPPPVSTSTFRKWYDEVHLPDMTGTPTGPPLALRYESINPSANLETGEASATVPWPYLTLYAVPDLSWLTTDFPSISHDSDLLPASCGHNAWGCFDAQIRSYEVTTRFSSSSSSSSEGGAQGVMGTHQAKYVITFEIPVVSMERFGVMRQTFEKLGGETYRGSVMYTLVPGLLEHEQKGVGNPGFVVSWFDEIPKVDTLKHGGLHIWRLVHVAGKEDVAF